MSAAALPRISASIVVGKPALQSVFDNLRAAGFTLIAPTVRDGAITLDEIERCEQLPVGWTEQQQPGRYTLARAPAAEYFAHRVGPLSWKRYLYPPRTQLLSAGKNDGRWSFQLAEDEAPQYAFIGIRSCDLRAIEIQDRVFLGGAFTDPHYARRRERLFVLAANCTSAAPTCFCSSTRTGPRVTSGFDLALTELSDSFLLEVGSEAGSQALHDLPWEPASAFDLGRANQARQRAEQQIHRELRTDDLPGLLYNNLEHAEWDAIAARCLSCANCPMVCPTCFCSTVEDDCDLRCTAATRTRVWDSCFVLDFSHVHGGNIRPTIRSRYRQWLTHKLASWIDQFGVLGCVGCGRCITWCPVGIDLTEEVRRIRGTEVK